MNLWIFKENHKIYFSFATKLCLLIFDTTNFASSAQVSTQPSFTNSRNLLRIETLEMHHISDIFLEITVKSINFKLFTFSNDFCRKTSKHSLAFLSFLSFRTINLFYSHSLDCDETFSFKRRSDLCRQTTRMLCISREKKEFSFETAEKIMFNGSQRWNIKMHRHKLCKLQAWCWCWDRDFLFINFMVS